MALGETEALAEWQKLKVVADVVPPGALALYGRWWQFETWLRELLYVELKAAFGGAWEGELPDRMRRQAISDRRHAYMSSPDGGVSLAYLDAGDLFDLIERHWALVSHGLLDDQDVWRGRVRELQKIRRRIAHCRRPHSDDIRRLEQTLRDIDPSAHAAITSFNTPSWLFLPPAHEDPVMRAWAGRTHPDARRLVDHVEQQYDISFRLHHSHRPWAQPLHPEQPVTGASGYLWHATWTFHGGIWDPGGFWSDSMLDPYRELLVFVLADPFSVEVSLPAVSDVDDINTAISYAFEAVVANRHAPVGYRDRQADFDDWYARYANRDWRLQMASPWNNINELAPCSIFQADGRTEETR